MTKLLSDEELTSKIAYLCEENDQASLLDLINTQKRLYAEGVIGFDWVNPKSDVQHAINDEHARQRARIK